MTDDKVIVSNDNEIENWKLIWDETWVTNANVINDINQTTGVFTKEMLSKLKWVPRPPPKALDKKERLKTPWDFFKSVFKGKLFSFIMKTTSQTRQLFWALALNLIGSAARFQRSSKMMRSWTESRSSSKQSTKPCEYNNLLIFSRETYKHESAISPAGMYPSIGGNVINEMISSCKDLVDNHTLNLSDVDLEFVATNAGVKNNPRNPERQLVRYQLMEYFCRIAKTKYVKNKICANMVEAWEKIYNDHLKSRFETYDCHKWRTTYLWNEHCDYVLKRYLPAIKKIYEKFSGRYAMPGAPKFMSSDEFFDLVEMIGIVNDNFGQREVLPIFNWSMMTQKSELDNDRHINMTLPEFIESIGRTAFKVKFKKMPYEYMQFMYEEMILDDPRFKDSPPLHFKIEALAVLMIKSCCGKDYRETLLNNIEKFYKEQYNAPKRTKYAHIGGPY